MHKLGSLRRGITELETSEAGHKQVEKELGRRAALAELVHDVALRTSGELEPNELFSAYCATLLDKDILRCKT
jgi:hypothetical protein